MYDAVGEVAESGNISPTTFPSGGKGNFPLHANSVRMIEKMGEGFSLQFHHGRASSTPRIVYPNGIRKFK